MVDTDFEALSAPEVGNMLSGFGVNLLVKDVLQETEFLRNVLGFQIVRASEDYAIAQSGNQLYQLHADHTYSSHPLLQHLPEAPPRGLGVELRLYDVDPDQAEQKAKDGGYVVLQTTMNKPHGLRECFLMDHDGYCWVPSRAI